MNSGISYISPRTGINASIIGLESKEERLEVLREITKGICVSCGSLTETCKCLGKRVL